MKGGGGLDYNNLHWNGDFMLNEIMGIEYDEMSDEDNHVVGYYTLSDYPEVNLYIDMETNKVIDVWLDEE